MASALARHDVLLRGAIEEPRRRRLQDHRRRLLRGVRRPRDCRQRPRSPPNARWRPSRGARSGGLRVRMALHTGEPKHRDGDYFGPPVNRGARLLAPATAARCWPRGRPPSRPPPPARGALARLDLGPERCASHWPHMTRGARTAIPLSMAGCSSTPVTECVRRSGLLANLVVGLVHRCVATTRPARAYGNCDGLGGAAGEMTTPDPRRTRTAMVTAAGHGGQILLFKHAPAGCRTGWMWWIWAASPPRPPRYDPAFEVRAETASVSGSRRCGRWMPRPGTSRRSRRASWAAKPS